MSEINLNINLKILDTVVLRIAMFYINIMLERGNKFQVFQNPHLCCETGILPVSQGGLELALFLLQLLVYWRLEVFATIASSNNILNWNYKVMKNSET